ncbi:MBL fold metallo-hydrolase [candidate division KSB1 bacterium]|nr:MBL fold metallo-hydrolase [candidate division KSB1 bacterium]
MKLRFWGTRGSIPSPGPETVKYGGNTTCVELLLNDGTLILFDAGTGIRNFGAEYLKQNGNHQINLFLTHSHWDHIQGFPFFKPAYKDDVNINIYGCPPTYNKLHDILTNQMESRYFPVNFDELKSKIKFMPINEGSHPIGSATFSFIENNHPGTAYGFKVMEDRKHIIFITDNELTPPRDRATKWEQFVEFCSAADILVHDAQYLEDELKNNSGFGHSSYEQTVELGLEAGVKQLLFFHHNPGRTDNEIDVIVDTMQKKLEGRRTNMTISAAREGQEIII